MLLVLIVTKFSNIDHTSETTLLSKESKALYKLYKLIKNKTEKKHDDLIEIYPNNEIDNLPDLEKNQDSIGKINMYNEHCLMEQDFNSSK